MTATKLLVSAILTGVGTAILFIFDGLAIPGVALFLMGLVLLGRRRTRRTVTQETRDLVLPVSAALAGVVVWYCKTKSLPGSRAMFVMPTVLWAGMMIGRIHDLRAGQPQTK